MCAPIEHTLDEHQPRHDEHLMRMHSASDEAQRMLNRVNHLLDFLETLNEIKYAVSFEDQFEDDDEGISQRSKDILTLLRQKCLAYLREDTDTDIKQFIIEARKEFPFAPDRVTEFEEFLCSLGFGMIFGINRPAASASESDGRVTTEHYIVPREVDPDDLARFCALMAVGNVPFEDDDEEKGDETQDAKKCPYGPTCPDLLSSTEMKCQRIAAHKLVFDIYLCGRAFEKIKSHPDLDMEYLCDITEEMNYLVLDLCTSLGLEECLPEVQRDMNAEEYAMSFNLEGEYNAEEEDGNGIEDLLQLLTRR